MEFKDFLQLVGVLVALGALIYTAINVDRNRKTARAQFWLSLREQFSKHDNVHRKLTPGGEWGVGSAMGPKELEWRPIESYMGLFEHCERMLSEKLIDFKTFKDIYGYRLTNILSNPLILQEKLIKRGEGWISFLRLVERLGHEITFVGPSDLTGGHIVCIEQGSGWATVHVEGKSGRRYALKFNEVVTPVTIQPKDMHLHSPLVKWERKEPRQRVVFAHRLARRSLLSLFASPPSERSLLSVSMNRPTGRARSLFLFANKDNAGKPLAIWSSDFRALDGEDGDSLT